MIVFPLIDISEPKAVRELRPTPVYEKSSTGDLGDSQGLIRITELPEGFYLNTGEGAEEVIADLARLDEYTRRAQRG